jgi:hypothetical protein
MICSTEKAYLAQTWTVAPRSKSVHMFSPKTDVAKPFDLKEQNIQVLEHHHFNPGPSMFATSFFAMPVL